MKEITSTWLSENVKILVEDLVDELGISVSEYIRGLILQDLDRRGILEVELQEEE